jgi:phage replication-related protein YjqB (UPF0714/DUF867 family)
MVDRYKNFAELSAATLLGVDYSIETEDRGTSAAILGIHGGRIEPATAEVVRAVAGTDLSYYLFIGHHSDLHITSVHFDEPICNKLVSKSKKVVTIHGKEGIEEFIMLGGLDTELISKTRDALIDAYFSIVAVTPAVAGDEEANICNKGLSGKGLQIELSRGLRDTLYRDSAKMTTFAQAVRSLLQ